MFETTQPGPTHWCMIRATTPTAMIATANTAATIGRTILSTEAEYKFADSVGLDDKVLCKIQITYRHGQEHLSVISLSVVELITVLKEVLL